MTPNLGWLKWAVPVLVLTQVALWASGASDARPLGLVIVIAESLLTIVVLSRTVALFRSSRGRAQPGDDWVDRVEAIFSGLLPDRVASFAASEVRVLATLLRWVIARIRRTPPVGYSSNRHQVLFGWVLLFALSAPAEMLLLHVLIPWNPVRYAVLAVEIYGLIWIAAIGVSFGFLRHDISTHGLRLQ